MNKSRDNLSETLQGWRVTPPADPGFRHRVWQRIGGQARISWPAYLRAHTAAWSLAAVLAVTVAAFTGSSLARAKVQADREAMVVTYLVELDPRVQAVLKP
jgi:hypothetical protein